MVNNGKVGRVCVSIAGNWPRRMLRVRGLVTCVLALYVSDEMRQRRVNSLMSWRETWIQPPKPNTMFLGAMWWDHTVSVNNVKGRVLFLQSSPTTVKMLGPHHCHCPSEGRFLYRWANFQDTCRQRSNCGISDLNHKVLLMHSATFCFNLARFCGSCCHLKWNPTRVKIWMAPL